MLLNILKSTRSSLIRTYSTSPSTTTITIPPLRKIYANVTSPLLLGIPKVSALANKFESVDEIFLATRKSMKEKGFTCQQRKAILSFVHQYRLGVDQLKSKKHKSPAKIKKK